MIAVANFDDDDEKMPDWIRRLFEELRQIRRELIERMGGFTVLPNRFKVREAAKLLKRSPATVRGWCEDRQVHAIRLRGRGGPKTNRWYLDVAEVHRLLAGGSLLAPGNGKITEVDE